MAGCRVSCPSLILDIGRWTINGGTTQGSSGKKTAKGVVAEFEPHSQKLPVVEIIHFAFAFKLYNFYYRLLNKHVRLFK